LKSAGVAVVWRVGLFEVARLSLVWLVMRSLKDELADFDSKIEDEGDLYAQNLERRKNSF
jgi:hypothetical protein